MKELAAAAATSPWETIAARIVGSALLLGLVADAFFYGRPLGVNVALYLALLLASGLALGHSKGIRPRRRNLWLIAPLLLAALFVAVRAYGFLTLLNAVTTLALLALLAAFYSGSGPFTLTLPGYALVIARAGLHSIADTLPLLPHLDLEALRQRLGRFLPVLRGLLLALPLLFFFTILLAASDLIFAGYVRRVLHLDWLPDLAEILWRLILIFFLAWLVAGGLAFTLLRGPHVPGLTAGAAIRRVIRLGFVEAATILLLVDLLFLAFVWVQAFYLFGGLAHLALEEGMTYAGYARRGFFELVAVAIFALAMLLLLVWLTRRHERHARWLFNAAGSLLLLFVGAMLVSAFYRLLLYEGAFGLTRLRLYVHVFMVWLALLLLWTLFTLWRPGGPAHATHRFAAGAVVAALGFLFTLNLLNPDAFIARYNLALVDRGGTVQPDKKNGGSGRRVDDLDAAYLTWLSDDAVPVLVGAVPRLPGPERERICRDLRWRQLRYEDADPLLSWHLGRARARRALQQPGWQQLCPPLEGR